MPETNSAPPREKSILNLISNDPKALNLNELKNLFLSISRTFADHLETGKVDDLKAIQHYLRKIKDEIELRDHLTSFT